MGVYINMEMPKEGFFEILVRDDGTVQQIGQSFRLDGTDYYMPYVGEMPGIYKAVPVPPHGRLIDGDVAEAISFTAEDAEGRDFYDGILYAADHISKQPTIIPASEEE